jgi:tetrahydromethanopterin S-methyltransferase subunit F
MGFAVSQFAASGTKLSPTVTNSGANVGLICGLVFGGLALILIIVAITFYVKK